MNINQCQVYNPALIYQELIGTRSKSSKRDLKQQLLDHNLDDLHSTLLVWENLRTIT